MFLLGFILYGTLCFLDLNDYFLMHCGDLNGKEGASQVFQTVKDLPVMQETSAYNAS